MSLEDNIFELKTYGTDNYNDIYSLSNNIVDKRSSSVIVGELNIYMLLFYAIFYYNTHLIWYIDKYYRDIDFVFDTYLTRRNNINRLIQTE